MSNARQQNDRTCVSCGVEITGSGAASFNCPECGAQIHRCQKCRKQSNLYECPECGFTGP